jgi:hypothetical protein
MRTPIVRIGAGIAALGVLLNLIPSVFPHRARDGPRCTAIVAVWGRTSGRSNPPRGLSRLRSRKACGSLLFLERSLRRAPVAVHAGFGRSGAVQRHSFLDRDDLALDRRDAPHPPRSGAGGGRHRYDRRRRTSHAAFVGSVRPGQACPCRQWRSAVTVIPPAATVTRVCIAASASAA